MSILIKGMKMPKHCWQCGLKDSDDECMAMYSIDRSCYAVNEVWGESKRPEWCPLIEIPDHGDLMDKTDFMASLADWQLSEAPEEGVNWDMGRDVTSHELQYSIYRLLGDVYEEVRDEPVVIPAERSE